MDAERKQDKKTKKYSVSGILEITQMQKTPGNNSLRSQKKDNNKKSQQGDVHDRARTRRGIGVHPALASAILFRFIPSELVVLLVGMPLTKCCSPPLLLLALEAGTESSDELGDLGTSFRRGLVGVDGPVVAVAGAPSLAEREVVLLIRPLPVLTGVPEAITESPSRRTRRGFEVVDTGSAVLAGTVGPLSSSAFCDNCLRELRELDDAFFSDRLAPERAREEPPSTSCFLLSSLSNVAPASVSAPASEEAGVGVSPSYSAIRASFQVTVLRDLDVALRLPKFLWSARG